MLRHFLDIAAPISLRITSASHTLSLDDIRRLVEITDASRDPLSKLTSIRESIKTKIRPHMLDVDITSFTGEAVDYCPAFKLNVMSANAGHGYLRKKAGNYGVVPINDDDNTNSVVIKATHKVSNQSVILTGDATGITTDQIIQYHESGSPALPSADLKTDIMLACHHGSPSHESNNKWWIAETKPKSTIFSCGRRQDYRHPDCSVVRDYVRVSHSTPLVAKHDITCGEGEAFISERDVEAPVYSTNDSGTIIALFTDREIRLQRPSASGVPEPLATIPRTPRTLSISSPLRALSLSTPRRMRLVPSTATASRGSGSLPLTPGSHIAGVSPAAQAPSRGSRSTPLTPGR